ncbi:IPT/TIG domain-containing protein [Bradyrhizobium sp. LTSP849]|uniref:IPT/TIG domain-containing protein n=1 Tax=Bradyrhizobium sp. LTSP849 TaxID=1615890 RepID=UPI0009E4F00F|nr:IPT/TIG domain-containing protein [Bradyrhizobium sp. LTSP849]
MQSFAVVRRILASYVPGSLPEIPEFTPPKSKRNKLALEAIAVLVSAVAIWFGGCAAVRADSAQYYYDPAGRLTVVVDPANGSAQYNYDAVGNILSVVRKPITDLVVAQASPSRGRAGDVVTIFGTGFGSLADTTVSFNGVSASPTAVSATQITVAVPSGATTGPVSVTSPAGSATSTASFTIPTLGTPTIASVSPTQVKPGDTITITGTNFDSVVGNNKVLVNGRYAQVSSANATTLTAVVPIVSSGIVTVVTPEGTGASSSYLTVTPVPYAPSNIGSVVASSIGNSVTLNIATAGQFGLIQFDATAGRRLAAQVTASSFGNGVQILGPDASVLGSTTSSTGSFADTAIIAQTGTYSVFIAPGGNSPTGSITIKLVDVPPDLAGTITAGGSPVSLTTTGAGQNASLTFTGVANERVSLTTQAGGCSWTVTVLTPDKRGQIYYNAFCGSGTLFTDVLVLPVAGTYTILFDQSGPTTGTATFSLYDVPQDLTATLTAGGGTVPMTTTAPGQNMSLTFSGTVNQSISLTTQASGFSCWDMKVFQPDGVTQFYSTSYCGGGTFFTDVLILPASGTYSILINPGSFQTGTLQFTLYNVPPDATGTLTAGGSAVPVTTTAPGQNMTLTFSGTANQRINLTTQNSGFSCWDMKVLQPDGTTQFYSTSYCGGGTFFTDVLVLPLSGTYTIKINPGSFQTGTLTLTLFNVPPDASGTITPGGSAVSLTTTVPGQNMSLTFTGAANQRVSLLLQQNGFSCWNTYVLQPDGTTQVYARQDCGSGNFFSDILVLPVAGTYTIQVNPGGVNTGTITFNLYDVPADVSATITPGGGTVSLTTTAPGQNMSMTFAGTANQRVSLLMTLTSGLVTGCSPLTIVQPNGTTQLFSNNCANYASFFTDVLVLPVTGAYTILFNPNSLGVGTGTFTLYDVPPDTTGATSVGQAAANYDVTVPGQAIQVTFAGAASQSVTVTVGRVSSTPSGACFNITTKKPDGSSLRGDGTCNNGYSSGSLTLPTAGTYTVVVDPTSTSIGTFSVGVSTP